MFTPARSHNKSLWQNVADSNCKTISRQTLFGNTQSRHKSTGGKQVFQEPGCQLGLEIIIPVCHAEGDVWCSQVNSSPALPWRSQVNSAAALTLANTLAVFPSGPLRGIHFFNYQNVNKLTLPCSKAWDISSSSGVTTTNPFTAFLRSASCRATPRRSELYLVKIWSEYRYCHRKIGARCILVTRCSGTR